MKRENRHKDDRASDFLKYSGDEMTGSERNAFEKGLQKDPFAEEAAEGFSGIEPDEALADLKELKKRIRRKASVKRRIGFYYISIAASIAALMIISSLWLFKEKNEIVFPSEKTAMDVSRPAAPKPENIIAQAKEEVTSDEAVNRKKAEPVPLPEAEKKQEQAAAVSTISEPAKTDYARAAEAAAPAAIGGVMKNAKMATATGALNDTTEQVVTLGYDTAAGNSRSGQETSAAVPVGGMDAFDAYARDNIRIPSTQNKGERKVVTAEVSISPTGAVGEIKIIRSPGKEYSDEAIRLIREGPEWEPAVIGGNKLGSVVRLKIVFKST